MTGGPRLVAINAEHQGSGREQVAIDDQALGRSSRVGGQKEKISNETSLMPWAQANDKREENIYGYIGWRRAFPSLSTGFNRSILTCRCYCC